MFEGKAFLHYWGN